MCAFHLGIFLALAAASFSCVGGLRSKPIGLKNYFATNAHEVTGNSSGGLRGLFAGALANPILDSAVALHAATGGVNMTAQVATTLSSANAAIAKSWRADALLRMNQSKAQDIKQQCNILSEYGPAPSECSKGSDHWNKQSLLEEFPGFTSMLREQQKALGPIHCCMGLNHMFALYSLVKKLKPAVIIESGIAAGHQTWMLRHSALPYTPIFAIDPGDPAVSYSGIIPGSFVGWKDPTGWTRYFTQRAFTDFDEIEWDKFIPDPEMRANTLVILDDHQSCVARFKAMQKWGFRWAFYEDNYPFKVATSNDAFTCVKNGQAIPRTFPVLDYAFGDAFSPNAACGAPLAPDVTSVLYKDKFGEKCTYITRQQHGEALTWLNKNMDVYFEFPALFTACPVKREPLLGSDPGVLKALGLPPVEFEIWQYGHLFPAFVELQRDESVLVHSDPNSPYAPPASTTRLPTTTTTTSTTKAASAIGSANVLQTEHLVGMTPLQA